MTRTPRSVVPRRRRTAEEARAAILDAAEAMLRDEGPAGVRLQDVARAVGVAHPTVLHHFGSREGLLDAVAERALATLRLGALSNLKSEPALDDVRVLLEAVAAQMDGGGRARTLLQLTLAGYGGGIEGLGLDPLVDSVHATRGRLWAARGRRKKPSREDTYFTTLLTTLALLSLSALKERSKKAAVSVPRFHAWLAALLHQHLQQGLER